MDRRVPIQECPVFSPSKREFADPLAYIRSIRAEGQKHGIVRIIPPDDWRPTLAMNTQTLKFTARIQRIDKLQNRARDVTRSEFMRELSEVAPDVDIPKIDGRLLDCLFLFQQVRGHNGFHEVCRRKIWNEIARTYITTMKVFSGNLDKETVKPLAQTLRSFYESYLLALELAAMAPAKPTTKRQSSGGSTPIMPSSPQVEEAPTAVGEVEALLAHERRGARFRYLVLWKGESKPTWEPRCRLSLQIRCDYEIFFPEEFGECKDFYEENSLELPENEWRELRRKVKLYRNKWLKYHELVKKARPGKASTDPEAYAQLWRDVDKPSPIKKESQKSVESILAHAKEGTGYRYLVLWEGDSDPVWQPHSEVPTLARCEYEAFYPAEFGGDDEESLPLREVRNIRGKERIAKWARYCQLVKSTFENDKLVEASAYAKLWRSLPVTSPSGYKTRSSSAASPSPSTSSSSATSPSTPSSSSSPPSSAESTKSTRTLRSSQGSTPPAEIPAPRPKRMKSESSSTARRLAEFDFECLHCHGSDFKDKLLTCAWCSGMYHTFCLMPTSAPENLESPRWICFDCRAANDGFGFDTGPLVSLAEFKAQADEFKQKRFPQGASEKEIIEEYWNIVEGKAAPATVQYGSDIDTLEHGSGFPATGVYARSGWNLCNLPKVANSLLKHLTNISGITVPWFYAGSTFSSFCWHNEDHYCYSINYVHTGAPKQWYGVPGLKSPEFEACAAKTLPDLFRIQPDLLYQMVTMLSPYTLREHGVPVFTTTQQPGQFVVTFPQAYHAGFNHGFNMAEAVNFAPADWLSFGVRGMEHYRRMHRPPVFPHDLLMCRLAEDSCTGNEELTWLLAGLRRMVNEERAARLALYSEGVRTSVHWDKIQAPAPSIENADARRKKMKGGRDGHHLAECCLCRHGLWVSAVRCGRCSPDRIACLRHAHLLCACPVKDKQFLFRYSTEELEYLVTQVTANLQKQEEQAKSNLAKRKNEEEDPIMTGPEILTENELILADLPTAELDEKMNSKSQDMWRRCIQEWVDEVRRTFKSKKHKILNKALVQELLSAASELNWGDYSEQVREYEEELENYESLLESLTTLCREKRTLKDALAKAGYSSLAALEEFLEEISQSPILCDREQSDMLEELSILMKTAASLESQVRTYTEEDSEPNTITLEKLYSLHDEATKLAVAVPAVTKLGLILKAANQWIEKVTEIVQSQPGATLPRSEIACALARQGTSWDFMQEVQTLQKQLKKLIDQTEASAAKMRAQFGSLMESSEEDKTTIEYSALVAAVRKNRGLLRTRESAQLEKAQGVVNEWAADAARKLKDAGKDLASSSVAELEEFLDELPDNLEGVAHQKDIRELMRARRWYDEVLAIPTEGELKEKQQSAKDLDVMKLSFADMHNLIEHGRAIAADQPAHTEWLALFREQIERQTNTESKAADMTAKIAAVTNAGKCNLAHLKSWVSEAELLPIRLSPLKDLRGAVHHAEDWISRVETLLDHTAQVPMADVKQLLDDSHTLSVDLAGNSTLARLETYECEARELLQHILAYLAKTADIPPLTEFLVREPPKQQAAYVLEQNTLAKTLLRRVSALKLLTDSILSLRALSWRLRIRLEVSAITSLTTLEDLIVDKDNVASIQDDCALLKSLLVQGKEWYERAVAVEETQKRTSVQELMNLIKEGQSLPFALPIEAELKAVLKRANKWIGRVDDCLNSRDDAVCFDMAQLHLLQEKGLTLKVSLPELEKLKQLISVAGKFERQLDKLFPRPNVLKLEDLLASMTEKGKETYCVCFQERPGSVMVCCDDCEKWFHQKCVRVKTKVAAKLEHYSCPACCEKKSVEYPFGACLYHITFPALSELEGLIKDFKAFPTLAHFKLFRKAEEVFLVAHNFRHHVRSALYADPSSPGLAEKLNELSKEAARIGLCSKENNLITARSWAVNMKKMLAPQSQTRLELLQDKLRDAPPREDLLMLGLPPHDSSNDAWVDVHDTLVKYVAWGRTLLRNAAFGESLLAATELDAFNTKTMGAVKVSLEKPQEKTVRVSKKRKSNEGENSHDDSRKNSGKQTKEGKKSSSSSQDMTLHCLCRKPYTEGFMVGCDKCDEWFHPKCINKTIAEVKNVETFICESCEQKK